MFLLCCDCKWLLFVFPEIRLHQLFHADLALLVSIVVVIASHVSLLFELPGPVRSLGMLGASIFLRKVALFNKGDKLLRVSECKGHKPEKVDKIFIGEYAIVNSLETLIQLDSSDKLIFVMSVSKPIDNSLNGDLFLIVGI